MADDGYMNEQHMGVVERALLNLSGTRRKLRAAAEELEADAAEEHLVKALRAADVEAEAVYKRLFQGTYFHVSEEQMARAAAVPKAPVAEAPPKSDKESLDVPEPAEEMRLFKAEDAHDPAKK